MKSFSFRELKDTESFDPSTISAGIPFTQASFFGDWQRNIGRTVRRFVVYSGVDQSTSSQEMVAYFQIISYNLFGNKKYLYIPYGPVARDFSSDFIEALKVKLIEISKEENAVFTRLDFTPAFVPDPLSQNSLNKSPLYTYHSAYFQPRLEWFLDLNITEEEIMNGMHKDTRYSIRTAEKREVTTTIVTSDFEKYFDIFYSLMSETAKRNKFGIHPKLYYDFIFKNLHLVPEAFLSIAKYADKILAISVIIPYSGIANYVYGASSSDERARMPAYASQWAAIKYAKSIGCNAYNFGGVSGIDVVEKSWDGLSSFKKKFGGYEVKHSDFYDIVVSPLWYHLYNFRKWMKSRTN